MYNVLVSIHSVLRWILALSLIITIFVAVYNLTKRQSFDKTKSLSLITLILAHTQFLIGIILYIISPKVIFSSLAMKSHLTRFFLVEHVTGMLIGIALITIGYASAKRAIADAKKHNRILVYYTIGFLVILAAIPWPFYNLGTGWL